MKKSHPFNKLSNVVCIKPGCVKKIKLRLAESKAVKKAFLCFKHFREKEAQRGHFIKNISYAQFKKP